MGIYISRQIDKYLSDWALSEEHKPLLLRGARQVGKSSAVRHLGEKFEYFAEINFEKQKAAKAFFSGDIDVKLIAAKISTYIDVPVEAKKTLLFLDEIQECPEAIMALRFFKEDYPELHVVAAGSLLEFALSDLPTYGVGRIRSLFMYPMTFDEFAAAAGGKRLLSMRDLCDCKHPLEQPFHEKLIDLFRIYLLVGGMPEAVATWINTADIKKCRHVHNDIILTYEDDFNKYKKKIDPQLLRVTMRCLCHQICSRLSYTEFGQEYKKAQLKEAIRLLTLAGIVIPVTATSGNGIPLDADANEKCQKFLFLDSGLLLSVLYLDGELSQQLIELILTGTPHELVNKGVLAEMVAGLELMRYKEPIQHQKLYYWQKSGKSIAEIDYLTTQNIEVLPVEVKSGTQGGMKSLWMFMHEKNIGNAVRTSLENFGEFDNFDHQDNDTKRHVSIIPLYAISKIVANKY